MNQTAAARGGGTGGLSEMRSAAQSAAEKAERGWGANSLNGSATVGNSIFKTGETAADFCSEFLAVAMARHNGHRCRPSKVCATASVTEWDRRLPASIVVHAMVCSAAQCAPVVRTSANTTTVLPIRANTGTG